MPNIRLALLAATAVTLTSTGIVFAAENKAYVSQTGSSNSASVDQSDGTANEVGAFGISANQDGADNILTVTQSGEGNTAGLAGLGIDQTGNGNEIVIKQTSDENVVGSVQQKESNAAGADGSNYLEVTQQGNGEKNSVSSVTQETSASGTNSAIVLQEASGNRIKAISQTNNAGGTNSVDVKMTGGGNGKADGLSGYAGATGVAGSTITQNGSNNSIEMNISGSDNEFGITQNNPNGGQNALSVLNIAGDSNELGISQTAVGADSNTLTIGGVLGIWNTDSIKGDRNNIGVVQQGAGINEGTIRLGRGFFTTSDDNAISLTQGGGADAEIVVYSGDFNDIQVSQQHANSGYVNSAKVHVTSSDTLAGPNNKVFVSQDSNRHTAVTTIVGNRNDSSIRQTQTDNEAHALIVGSDNKLDAQQTYSAKNGYLQASIEGNDNVVTVLQRHGGSHDNQQWINVLGGSNVLKQEQNSSSNSNIIASVTGYDNTFTTTQVKADGSAIGDNNSLTLIVIGSSNGATDTFSGVASGLGLDSGSLMQKGSNNMALLTIASSDNLLAMEQLGDDNSATVTIGGGNSNEVAISQSGGSNYSYVSQDGSSNSVGISQ